MQNPLSFLYLHWLVVASLVNFVWITCWLMVCQMVIFLTVSFFVIVFPPWRRDSPSANLTCVLSVARELLSVHHVSYGLAVVILFAIWTVASGWLLYLLWPVSIILLHFSSFSLHGTINSSRIIFFSPCPSPDISHYWFILAEWALSMLIACRTSQWTELMSVCINTA